MHGGQISTSGTAQNVKVHYATAKDNRHGEILLEIDLRRVALSEGSRCKQ